MAFLGMLLLFALSFSACGNDSDSVSSAVESPEEVEEIESSDGSDSSKAGEKSSSSSKNGSSSSEKSESSSSLSVSSSSKAESSSSEDLTPDSSASSSGSAPQSSSENTTTSSDATSSSSVESSAAESSNSESSSSYEGLNPGDLDRVTCVTEGLVTYYLDENKNRIGQICQDGLWTPIESSSSSSNHYDMAELFNESVSYNTLVDSRDGKSYRTVEYKGILTFEIFAENLNYGNQVLSTAEAFSDTSVEKFCYKDDAWYCDNGFGGLYSWSEAMNLPHACDSLLTGTDEKCINPLLPGATEDTDWSSVQIQGICPNGWHILNEAEWSSMVGYQNYVGSLTSSAFGNSNEYGISLLPGGVLNTAVYTEYQLMLEYGAFWLPQEYNKIGAYVILYSMSKWIPDGNEYKKSNGMSVRCVKDYEVQ